MIYTGNLGKEYVKSQGVLSVLCKPPPELHSVELTSKDEFSTPTCCEVTIPSDSLTVLLAAGSKQSSSSELTQRVALLVLGSDERSGEFKPRLALLVLRGDESFGERSVLASAERTKIFTALTQQ